MLDSLFTTEVIREHLDEARHASLRHIAISPEAAALRDNLLPILDDARDWKEGARTRKPNNSAMVSQQLTLDAILADLILASGNTEALGFFYRQSKRTEFTGNNIMASSRAYEWQIDALKQLGLIDVRRGFTKYDDFDGSRITDFRKASRIRATPDLLVRARELGITYDSLYQHYALERVSNRQPLIVRAGKSGGDRGKIIRYPLTSTAVAVQSEVERINNIYGQHKFQGMPEPQVYRGFNLGDAKGFRFNKGGRLYGAFQQMPRESRRNILIDGHPVVELDLKAAHLTILYHVTGTRMAKGDLYAIEGLPRPLVKAAITSMIGKGKAQLTLWTRRMRERIADDTKDDTLRNPKVMRSRYPAKSVADKIIDRHPALLSLVPGELDWADLQYLESQVLIDTILHLGELHEVPALPIHDSIIVAEKDEEVSRWYLWDAFRKVTGGEVVIEKK